ncbi:unnamed protein product [Linum trigynum]|uniref:Secreted protein n=1 Tax=Linum trigynum TaxID=586398 RepID=A0AAV2CD16_9ROSI
MSLCFFFFLPASSGERLAGSDSRGFKMAKWRITEARLGSGVVVAASPAKETGVVVGVSFSSMHELIAEEIAAAADGAEWGGVMESVCVLGWSEADESRGREIA